MKQSDLKSASWFLDATTNSGSEEELELRARFDSYSRAFFENRTRPGDKEEGRELEQALRQIGNAVYRVVPPCYEAYCKVLPAFEEVLDEDGNRVADVPPLSFGTAQTPPAGGSVRRRTWKEVCAEFGVSYVKELSHSSFSAVERWPQALTATGGHGHLDDVELNALQQVLLQFAAKDERIFFYYWLMKTPEYEDRLYEGVLGDVLTIGRATELEVPSAFWPEDRSWFVAIDYDLDFSLVGGSKVLIQSLVESKKLECIEVDPSTRVDYRADKVNR
jgi:hypothetical protein